MPRRAPASVSKILARALGRCAAPTLTCLGLFGCGESGEASLPSESVDGAGGAAGDFASLREAAAHAGKHIGAAVDAAALLSDPTYSEVLAREFDSITPENATKWGPLAPARDSYDWQDADAIVEFAEDAMEPVFV